MENVEKVVLRFNSGKILKGYVVDFLSNMERDKVIFKDDQTQQENSIPISELKAIFFVKTFKGNSRHKDKKSFGIRNNVGRKIYVRFNDGESMIGFLEGEIPWEKGFFLSKADNRIKGFFLIPVDAEGNNIKVFVISSSIKDVAMMS
ncbi:MAG: hypothetical protein AB1610_04200 [Nitrospirota bacterium]